MIKQIKVDILKKEIELTYHSERLHLPNEIQNKINAYWEKRIMLNPQLRRGKVFCINNRIENDDKIVYELVDTDYAHYLYTLNCPIEERYACKVCFAVGLIITSDNKYIIGQMNQNTATPQRLQLPGGGLEEQDIVNGKICLEQNLDRELTEEIGFGIFNKKMVASVQPKYVKYGGKGDFVAFVYNIKSCLSSIQLREHFKNFFDNYQGKAEFSNIYFIEREKNAVEEFLSKVQFPIVDYLYPVILADISENEE